MSSDDKTTTGDRAPFDPTIKEPGKGGTLPLTPQDRFAPNSIETRDIQLKEVIGRGGMGQVYRGEQRRLGRHVAFKELLGGDDENQRERFVREARITAQLDHPNIVPIHSLEVSSRGDVIGYAMKLVEGNTLAALLTDAHDAAKEGRPLEPSQRLPNRIELFLKICDAISFAHDRGILHRDLKPANVMIGKFGEVYVMDWGIARPFASTDEAPGTATHSDSSSELTREGEVIGSVSYMSPEQAAGLELDARSDQYSLGLILFEIIGLRRARTPGEFKEVLERALGAEKVPLEPATKNERIARELRAVVDKATALRPDHRYPSVAAMADDLRRYVRGEAVVARPDRGVEKVLRWIGRHRRTTLALLLGVLASSALVVGWISYRKTTSELETRRRGERTTALFIDVASQAHRIDAQFQLMEEGLEGLRTSAEWALGEAAPNDGRVFLSTDFHDPARRPADFTDKTTYRWPVSVTEPVVSIAPGVDPQAVMPKIRRLLRLRPTMIEMFLAAGGLVPSEMGADARRTFLLQRKGPIDYAYVDLREGVHFQLPGNDAMPPDYDVRTSGFYTMSANKHGRRWGAPYVDATTDSEGDDLVLPCTQGLWSASGEFLGVAGVEMTVTKLVDTELTLPSRKTVRTSLVNAAGQKVIDSGDANKRFKSNGRDDAGTLYDFDIPTIVNEVKAGRSGVHELDVRGRKEIVVLARLDVLGWFYVVEIDAASL